MIISNFSTFSIRTEISTKLTKAVHLSPQLAIDYNQMPEISQDHKQVLDKIIENMEDLKEIISKEEVSAIEVISIKLN
jgi:hypothetical protein